MRSPFLKTNRVILRDHGRGGLLRLHHLRRKRRDLLLVERPDDLRRHHHHQFGFRVGVARVPEENAENRDVPEQRDLGYLPRDLVVDEPGQDKGLPVRQLQPRLGLPGSQRGELEARDCDAIREVQLADLLRNLHVDIAVADDPRLEREADPELLVAHRGRCAGTRRTGDHDGELSPDEELPLVAVRHDEVRLRQGLDRPLVVKNPQHCGKFGNRTGCDNKELRQVADGAVKGIPARDVSGKRIEAARGDEEAAVSLTIDDRLKQHVEAEFLREASIHLGNPDLEQHLLELHDLEEVHDGRGVHLGAFHDAVLHQVGAHRPGENQGVPGCRELERLIGGDLPQVLPDRVQVDPDDDLGRRGNLFLVPVDKRRRPRDLPDDEQLPRGYDHDVGGFRLRDENPPDIEVGIEQDRLVGVHEDRLGGGRRLAPLLCPDCPDGKMKGQKDREKDQGQSCSLTHTSPPMGDWYRILYSNFYSDLLFPLITSTVKVFFATGRTRPWLWLFLRRDRFSVGSVRSGVGPPGRKAARTRAFVAPNVTTLSESMKFRRTSCMTPSLLASASFSASSGVKESVTVFTVIGLFSFCSTIWPAASTGMFSSTILEIFSLPLTGVVVKITSTLVYGTMNPPTPTTSFTRMVNARFPSGTRKERSPPPLSVGTSFDATIGSPRRKSRLTARPTTDFRSAKESFGYRSFCHAVIATWLALIVEPMGMSTSATTIPTVCSRASSAARPFSERYR